MYDKYTSKKEKEQCLINLFFIRSAIYSLIISNIILSNISRKLIKYLIFILNVLKFLLKNKTNEKKKK